MFWKICKGYFIANTLFWAAVGVGEYLSRNWDRNGYKNGCGSWNAWEETKDEAFDALYGYGKDCADCVKEILGF